MKKLLMKSKLSLSETVKFPKKINSKGLTYKDKYCKIEKLVADFGDFYKEYLIVHYGKNASLIAVKKNKILLSQQYRLIINALSFEVPGGGVEKNELPKKAAIRECFEETGVACRKLKYLFSYNTALEYINNYNYIFFSRDINEKKIKKNCQWVPLSKCLQMIKSGKISDSLTIISILMYKNFTLR